MTEEGYAEVDGAAYERLRKSLLREKGGDRQREFLAAARSSERFLDYFGREAPVTAGATVPVYEDYFTEESYRDPPADVEEELYAVWLELTPRVACRATLWAAVTLDHIDHGRIESCFLAGDGGSKSGTTGAQRIDYVVAKADPKPIDDCVRTIMRNLSGLPEARGNRSVYVAEQGILGAADDADRVTQLGVRIQRGPGCSRRRPRQVPRIRARDTGYGCATMYCASRRMPGSPRRSRSRCRSDS